ALSATATPAIFSRTAESCPAAYPPGRTLPAPERASPAELLRWEFPGPLTTPAARVHTALDLGQKSPQRGAVRGVALHHFVGQRKTFRGDDQGDHHLPAVEAVVAAVAVLGLGNLLSLSLD